MSVILDLKLQPIGCIFFADNNTINSSVLLLNETYELMDKTLRIKVPVFILILDMINVCYIYDYDFNIFIIVLRY